MPFLLNVIVLALFESQYQKSSPQRIESRVSLILVLVGRVVVVEIQSGIWSFVIAVVFLSKCSALILILILILISILFLFLILSYFSEYYR